MLKEKRVYINIFRIVRVILFKAIRAQISAADILEILDCPHTIKKEHNKNHKINRIQRELIRHERIPI